MLIVVQFPMGDARGLTSEGAGRVSRPDWGNIETFGNTAFVRYFGRVADRSRPADAAWVDERYFCHAKHALVLPELQADRTTRCAFRRLFVADGRVVARVEVGFVPPPTDGTAAGLLALAGSIARLPARVPEDGGAGSTRALTSQGRRLARLYAFSTTKKDAAPESRRLVEAGRPMILLELRQSEAFVPPPGATVIDADAVGGCDLAFLWLKTDDGAIPMWIMRRGRDPSRARSLRLCLLRVNAEQEALAVIARLINREVLRFEPETDPGRRLRDYLNDTTRNLKRDTWAGISQTAVIDAIAAAEQVTYTDDREGLRRNLEGIEHQIVAKTDSYLKERDAPRTVNTYTANEGGTIVNQNQNINITDSHVENVAFVNALRDAIVTIQGAPVSDERKKAVEDLVKVATDLVEKLPDDKAKADVTKRVEVITQQAADPAPLEDIVRAAGETIVKIGQGVGDLAGPIAKAVNTVLSVLKFAPLVL